MAFNGAVMQTSIRKWGNSAGARIPAGTLKKAGLAIGDALEIEVIDNAIVMRAAKPEYSLEDLLAATPSSAIELSAEDEAWLGSEPVGQEEL